MTWALRLLVVGSVFLWPGLVQAADYSARDVQLRVMATSVPVRAGPGGSYQELGRVGKGQVYQAQDRSPDGAWYRIRLARGVSGWVLSELVWPFEVVDEGATARARGWMRQNVLGKSPIGDGGLRFGFSGGALDSDGYFALRLGYAPSRHYAIELLASQSSGGLGSLSLYGAELVVSFGPWRSLVPFAAVGGGGATALPHRESRLFAERTLPMLMAGGGLMLALKGGFSVRFDARRVMFFSADETWGMVALLGGLMLTY